MSLDFTKAAERWSCEGQSERVKEITILNKESKDSSYALFLLHLIEQCDVGHSPEPSNIGFSNYHWDDENPNKLVLKECDIFILFQSYFLHTE